MFGLGARKRSRFIELLAEHSQYAVSGMEALLVYMHAPSPESAKQVKKIEQGADELRRVLIDELNRSFVTPIDREDIYALSHAISDVLDYAYSTVEEMDILGVKTNSYLQRMTSLLADASREVYLGILQIQDHPNVANDHAVRAMALENRMEGVYREAIGALFAEPKNLKQMVAILKLREVYRHLSNAADYVEKAANVLGDIVVKKV
jgi:uncharacterized protein